MFLSIINLECEVFPRRDNLNENGTKQLIRQQRQNSGGIYPLILMHFLLSSAKKV